MNIIGPQASAQSGTIPSTRRRKSILTYAGLATIILLVVLAFALLPMLRNRSQDEQPFKIVIFQPGVVDLEPGVYVQYHDGHVGDIDSLREGVSGLQLFIKDGNNDSSPWNVITFFPDRPDSAQFKSFTLIYEHGVLFLRTGQITLVACGNSGGMDSIFTVRHTDVELRINNGNPVDRPMPLGPGDEIAVSARTGAKCVVRWSVPSLYTKVYAHVDLKLLKNHTAAVIDSSALINNSTIFKISTNFGLTKTTANISPSFAPSICSHVISESRPGGKPEIFMELSPGSDFVLDDLKETAAFLTDRRHRTTPPSSRAEAMVANVDLALQSFNNQTLPIVNATISSVGKDIQKLRDSVDTTLAVVRTSVAHLSNNADTSVSKITNNAMETLAALRLRLDMLTEELTLTTTQLRKTVRTTGDGLHKIIK